MCADQGHTRARAGRPRAIALISAGRFQNPQLAVMKRVSDCSGLSLGDATAPSARWRRSHAARAAFIHRPGGWVKPQSFRRAVQAAARRRAACCTTGFYAVGCLNDDVRAGSKRRRARPHTSARWLRWARAAAALAAAAADSVASPPPTWRRHRAAAAAASATDGFVRAIWQGASVHGCASASEGFSSSNEGVRVVVRPPRACSTAARAREPAPRATAAAVAWRRWRRDNDALSFGTHSADREDGRGARARAFVACRVPAPASSRETQEHVRVKDRRTVCAAP